MAGDADDPNRRVTRDMHYVRSAMFPEGYNPSVHELTSSGYYPVGVSNTHEVWRHPSGVSVKMTKTPKQMGIAEKMRAADEARHTSY